MGGWEGVGWGGGGGSGGWGGWEGVGLENGQNLPENQNIKSRALPVTSIFMPDFRHAHTLQQFD